MHAKQTNFILWQKVSSLLAYYFDIIGTVGSKTCSRVNECKLNNGECSQICVDTYDSYYCACHDGYELAENTYNCPCKSLRFPYDLLYLLRQSVGFIPVVAANCSRQKLF